MFLLTEYGVATIKRKGKVSRCSESCLDTRNIFGKVMHMAKLDEKSLVQDTHLNEPPRCPVMTLRVVAELNSIVESILAYRNTKETVYVFVGQSANYLYHTARIRNDVKCSLIALPISGYAYLDDISKPSKYQQDQFCSLLKKLGVIDSLKSSKLTTVFVDFMATGTSLKSLSTAVNKCIQPAKTLDVILLLRPERNITVNELRDKGVYCVKQIKSDINIAMANENVAVGKGKFPRTIAYYPRTKWDADPEEIKNPSALACIEELKICQRVLEMYYNFVTTPDKTKKELLYIYNQFKSRDPTLIPLTEKDHLDTILVILSNYLVKRLDVKDITVKNMEDGLASLTIQSTNITKGSYEGGKKEKVALK